MVKQRVCGKFNFRIPKFNISQYIAKCFFFSTETEGKKNNVRKLKVDF